MMIYRMSEPTYIEISRGYVFIGFYRLFAKIFYSAACRNLKYPFWITLYFQDKRNVEIILRDVDKHHQFIINMKKKQISLKLPDLSDKSLNQLNHIELKKKV